MAHANINGANLFYEDRGTGPAIIFHHGYTGSHHGWVPTVDALQSSYRCVMMDCRGACDSEHTADGYSIEQYAKDVVGMADFLGIDRFIYVGHSMGGAIGFRLGVHCPERLEKLVLVAPAPADGIQTVDENARLAARRQWANKEREAMIAQRYASSPRPQDDPVERQVDGALSVSEGHYDGSWESMRDLRLGDQLGDIRVPTLMIAGAADGLLTPNLKDFQRLGNATLHVFSRVGHQVPREVRTEFNEVLLDFFEHGVVNARTLQERVAALSR